MNCIEAREAMLSVEPAALRADGASALGASALGEHLVTCDDCRILARAISGDLASLPAAVARRSGRRWRRGAMMVGIPIAAAIVGVIVVKPAHAPAPVNVQPTGVVSVQPAPGQSAAVLQTIDPRVTIVIITPEAEP